MIRKIYVIAGEASGDLLGAGLMKHLTTETGGVARFFGVGGERMEEQGLESLFPYHELSLMGFVEILPHMYHLLSRISLVVEDILLKRPEVVVTIDSPGFNFRVVEKLRKRPELKNTKFIHYVAPTVWAYKPERAKKCARLFDYLMVILPFEPPYFTSEGLPTSFVGHPVAFRKADGDAAFFREKYKVANDAPILSVFPGSRENEIRRHMPIFGPALGALATLVPDLVLVVPVAPRFLPLLAEYFKGCPFRAILLGEVDDKKHALAASKAALVKSGTVSLEVARAGVPQIVTYKANAITAAIVKRMVKTRFANLINIICDHEVIPELLQDRCTSEHLENALEALLHDEHMRATQRQGAAEVFQQLQAPYDIDPSLCAAQKVLEVIDRAVEIKSERALESTEDE